MQTNANPEAIQSLNAKGQALLDAAYDFWREHQTAYGPNAVVWLRDTNDHFVLFTRGEYLDAIMRGARLETDGQEPLVFPEQSWDDDGPKTEAQPCE